MARIEYPPEFNQLWFKVSTAARSRSPKKDAFFEWKRLIVSGHHPLEIEWATFKSYDDTPPDFHRGLQRQLRDHVEPLIMQKRWEQAQPLKLNERTGMWE